MTPPHTPSIQSEPPDILRPNSDHVCTAVAATVIQMREVEAGKGGREGGGVSRCYLDPRPSSPPTLLRLPSVSLETDTSQHPTDQSSHARPGRWDRRGFHLWPRLLENQRKEKEREGGTDGKAMCGICDHPWTPRASNGS